MAQRKQRLQVAEGASALRAAHRDGAGEPVLPNTHSSPAQLFAHELPSLFALRQETQTVGSTTGTCQAIGDSRVAAGKHGEAQGDTVARVWMHRARAPEDVPPPPSSRTASFWHFLYCSHRSPTAHKRTVAYKQTHNVFTHSQKVPTATCCCTCHPPPTSAQRRRRRRGYMCVCGCGSGCTGKVPVALDGAHSKMSHHIELVLAHGGLLLSVPHRTHEGRLVLCMARLWNAALRKRKVAIHVRKRARPHIRTRVHTRART